MRILNSTGAARSLQKLFTGLVTAAGLALTLALNMAAPNRPKLPPCDELSGRFILTEFAFDSETTAHATAEIWRDGTLVGYATAKYFNIDQKGNGVLQMNGHHVQTYLDGSTLETDDEIRLLLEKDKPGVARANSRLYVAGGTGRFAGATGLFHTHGEVNLVTLEGGIDFKGQVCVP